METQYLNTFKMVLKTGSFSRAAEMLCLSQSTVSQRIKLLEDHYGCKLIDRAGSILRATAPGEKILNKIDVILKAELEIEKEIKNIEGTVQISIGTTPTFGIVYVPKVLQLFMGRKSDDINLEFLVQQHEQLVKSLVAEDLDIIIVEHCDELMTENVACFPLPPDGMVLVSSPSLQIPSMGPPLESIFKYHLITRREGCSSRCLLRKNLCHLGYNFDNFKGTDVYDDLHLIIQAILQGQGVSFISRDLVADHIARGEIREHVVPGFTYTRSRTLAMNHKRIGVDYLKFFVVSVHSIFGLPAPFGPLPANAGK